MPATTTPSRPRTRVVHLGLDPFRFDGFVNPPVVRGSTVLSPTYKDLVGHTAATATAGAAIRPPRRFRMP